jgi:hypothetical protein
MLSETKIGIQADIPTDTVISANDDSIASSAINTLSVINTSDARVSTEIGKTIAEAFDFGIAGEDIIFSKPVKISVSTDLVNGSTVQLGVKHNGDIVYNSKGLSSDANTLCDSE